MALAPDRPLQLSTTTPHPHIVEFLEFSLATLGAVAPFSAAVAAFSREGRLEAYAAVPSDADPRQLLAVALERLSGAGDDAAGLHRDEVTPTPIRAPLVSRPFQEATFLQSAPVTGGEALRGVVVLWRAQAPPVAGAAALYAIAQALSRALDRQPAGSVASESAFIQLADVIGEGLVRVDDEGRAHVLNGAGARLLGSLGGEDGETAPAVLLDAVAAAGSAGHSLRDAAAQTPEARHIKLAAVVQGSLRLVALDDHTEEKLLQERLLQSEKMASVGQLVSGVAHELNNPLTGVMGFAQLLLTRELDETVRTQVETIYGEAERAAKIVQNLLSFARRRKPAKEMADVNSLLQRVLELRSYDFTIRNIALDMTLDSRMPRVWVDPDQVQQVFFNVIKNAEQAMIEAKGGGTLTVVTSGTPVSVRVSIADSGPGIPADIQRRIFDPFFTTKEAGQGTGLGLTICYSIIDEHGGRIWAENAPGGGAVFVTELPLGVPEEGPTRLPDGGAPSLPSASVRGKRVLVVDDEESIRLLLRDILEMDSHQVEVASSGLEALERLDGREFDLVITDFKMPAMDGGAFYREVEARQPQLAKRIIFITGDTVSPDTRAFLQGVSNPVLNKPFKIGPLREAMEAVLNR